MRKKKKPIVLVDEPRSAKPFAVMFSLAAVVGGCAIVFNAFFNQQQAGNGAQQAGNVATQALADGAKGSRTILLKYEALVEDVQRELMNTGHFNGLVDGVTGPKTRVAIEAYQRDNKMDVTGVASKELLEHILYTRKLNQAAEFTGSLPKLAPTEKTIVHVPVQPHMVSTQDASANPQTKSDSAIVKLQHRLAALGYDPGSRSGQMDEGTRSAILIFEMDYGLAMHGKISKSLLQAIKTAEAKKLQ